MTTMRSMNPSAPNFINATTAASSYGDFVSKPKFTETEKFLQNLMDRRDKIKLEERLALQDERQSRLDEQNKQLFDLKIADIDRANKDREALIQFSKGMLQPQVISGIVTDTISPEQVEKMSFTPEELAQYNAAGGDIGKLIGSAKTKAELQAKLSNFADILPSSPEYQETAYQQAQRVASGMELTPGILEELKKYQVADITAQKEAKKDGAAYVAEAKELETKIAELRTKQGAKADDIIGLGKEWGKVNSNGSPVKSMGYADLVKFTKEAAKTDSDQELKGMLKSIFDDTTLTKQQKEDAANNILVSSGAYDNQGFFDIGAKNVDIEAAKKANLEYGTMLDRTKNLTSKVESSEIEGIKEQIALLEARRAGALAKADAYSNDRNTAAKTSMKARIDELLNGPVQGSAYVSKNNDGKTLTERINNPGAIKQANKGDKSVMWKGQTGYDDQGHAIFDTLENGFRAQAINLNTQISKKPTVEELIKGNPEKGIGAYATGNQNEYVKFISDKLGVDKNYSLKPDDIPRLLKAQSQFEGSAFNETAANTGYQMAVEEGKIKVTPKTEVKDLFAKVEESRNSKGKDAQGVLDYYSKKREDIANIKTNAWDRTVNAVKGGPTVDDGYGKLTGKSYSKDISNVSDALRKDGFNSVEDIAILATNMPEGKDKEAVANVLHYKLMQSDPEYRQLMKDQERSDAAWLAAETILTAGPIGKVIGNVARRVVGGPRIHTTALPNGWAGTTGREAMEKVATQAAAEKAATKAAAKAAMQKRIAALEHDLQQLGRELDKNKIGSGMTRAGLEKDYARIRKAQKELQDRLKGL